MGHEPGEAEVGNLCWLLGSTGKDGEGKGKDVGRNPGEGEMGSWNSLALEDQGGHWEGLGYDGRGLGRTGRNWGGCGAQLR